MNTVSNSDRNKIKLVAVIGPTASGKTSLGVEIAKKYNGEIVSADSMQIYKGMQIATAKPTLNEMCGIKHHFIDFVDPSSRFSVAEYVDLAHQVIKDIYLRGKLPVIVGGTGLYIDSLLNNINFLKETYDKNIRDELLNLYHKNGIAYLLDMLKEFDLPSAVRLSKEINPKRIIRAIEVYKSTGITMTQHNENSLNHPTPYSAVKIGLSCKERQKLYDRINMRVDVMVANGLIEECKEVLNTSLSETSVKAIGYKELVPYFNQEKTLEECIEKLKMETRRYAKRQLTWFKRDESIKWIYTDTFESNEKIIEYAFNILKCEGFD